MNRASSELMPESLTGDSPVLAGQKEHGRFSLFRTELSGCLARGDIEKIKILFTQIAPSPMDMEQHFDFLKQQFTQARQEALLFDLMMAEPTRTMGRLRLIADTIELGRAVGREAEALKAIADMTKSPNLPPIRWGASDQLNRFRHFGSVIFREFRELKYLGVPRLQQDLFGSADALADRIDLPQPMLDRLYRGSRYPEMARADWERAVRSAFAADHITKDFMSVNDDFAGKWLGKSVRDPVGHIIARAHNVLANMDPTKGLLVVTFHGGFSRMALVLYQHLFKDGLIMLGGKGVAQRKGPVSEKFIVVWGNERPALFQAVRALQDGKTLWVGGDAPFGNRKNSISMLGATLPVPDGPAFLAYETRCNTAWLSFVREGDGIAPVLVAGPVRETKERYQEFKDRWLAFYAQRIDEFLTGDPRNLALRPHLIEILNKP